MADSSQKRPRPQSPPRRQRACVPCSSAKAKCHFQDCNVKRHLCDRCEKMGIACAPKSSKSLRKPRQLRPLNNRVSCLEKQVETLTAALEGANQMASLSTTPLSPTRTNVSAEQDKSWQDISESQQSLPPVPPACATQTQSKSLHGLIWTQSDRILSLFREKYLGSFPFLVLDPLTSAEQLHAERPFLFRVIMLAAAPLPIPRVVEMKRNALAYLGQHMLVDEERQLDLLQGLLVCISWADLRTLFDEQITSLTYLALGYAHNLGITKIPNPLLQQIGMDDAPEDVRQPKRDMLAAKMHSIEEQRTFLGCYCLLSVNSTLFGRQNPLRSHVRLVQMGEKISEAFGAANDRERGKPYLFLLDDQSRGFRQELDSLMESLDRQQRQYRVLNAHQVPSEEFDDWERFFSLHYNYLLVRLYEPATFLHEIPEDSGAPSTYRLQCLRNCLFAAKAYFDILFTLSPTQYIYQSITFTEQITFVLVITTRLLLLETKDWDVHFGRMTMNFLSVVDRLVQCLESSEAERIRSVGRFVTEMGIEASEADLAAEGRVAEISKKMRWIRTWFEKRVNEDELANQPPQRWPVEELENRGARAFGMGANGSVWFTGLLSNSAWNFDDVEL